MLGDAFEAAGSLTPAELLSRYEARLAETVETVGEEAVIAETDVDAEMLRALLAGESPEITLAEAMGILATEPGTPDAETLLAEAHDRLLLGMTAAVVDVEAVETGIDGRMEATEIQQKVEGRRPMSLAEYALLRQFLESRKPP